MYIYIKFQLSNKSIFIVIIAILLEFGNINNDEKEESDDVCWIFYFKWYGIRFDNSIHDIFN